MTKYRFTAVFPCHTQLKENLTKSNTERKIVNCEGNENSEQ